MVWVEGIRTVIRGREAGDQVPETMVISTQVKKTEAKVDPFQAKDFTFLFLQILLWANRWWSCSCEIVFWQVPARNYVSCHHHLAVEIRYAIVSNIQSTHFQKNQIWKSEINTILGDRNDSHSSNDTWSDLNLDLDMHKHLSGFRFGFYFK